MEFTIYSVGSAQYLGEILNSVAMMAGTGSFASSAKVGLLLGVFLVAFQALAQGTGIQFQKAGVCLIIYMAMFGSNGTAVIEDVYTGEVVAVDNVPLGPLVAGSFISNLGFKITEEMEQAFSTPAMTEYGFADPLNVLMAVRQSTMDMQKIPGFNSPTSGTDFVTSWANYIRECTMVQAASNPTLMTQIYSGNPIESLKFSSQVYGTRIYVDGPKDLSCTEAFDELSGSMGANADRLFESIAPSLPGYRKDDPMGSVGVESRINDAIAQMGVGMGSARDFVQASVLLPLVQMGPQSKAISDQQGNAAIMMNQAILQQNTQWAAEGSMFTQYARPFMTFFEGFIYAITPIVAFLVVLGPQGISLVGKYMLILCWLMLWLPIMAVVNLYLLTTVSDQITAVLGTSSNGLTISYASMMEVERIIEKQLGVAGMMLSSVPGLVMFLLYGSSVAATSMASKLGGSDTINEKIAAPDLVQPNATLAMSSQYLNDPSKGTWQTGSSGMVQSIGMQDSVGKQVESARANMSAASQSWSDSSSAAFSDTMSRGNTISGLAEMGRSLTATSSEGVGTQASQAVDSLVSNGVKREHAEAAVAAFTMNGGISGSATAGLKLLGTGVSAEVNAGAGITTRNTGQDSESASVAEAISKLSKSDAGKSLDASLSESNGRRLATSVAESEALQSQISNGKQLAETGSRMLQSQDSYKEAQTASTTLNIGSTQDVGTWGAMVLHNDKGDARYGEMMGITQSMYGADYQRNYQMLEGLALDDKMRSATAAVATLGENGRFDLINSAVGRSGVPQIDANQNVGLESPNVGDVRGRVESAPGIDADKFASNLHKTEAGIHNEDLRADYAANASKVDKQGSEWRNEVEAKGAGTVNASEQKVTDLVDNTTLNALIPSGQSGAQYIQEVANQVKDQLPSSGFAQPEPQTPMAAPVNDPRADLVGLDTGGGSTGFGGGSPTVVQQVTYVGGGDSSGDNEAVADVPSAQAKEAAALR